MGSKGIVRSPFSLPAPAQETMAPSTRLLALGVLISSSLLSVRAQLSPLGANCTVDTECASSKCWPQVRRISEFVLFNFDILAYLPPLDE